MTVIRIDGLGDVETTAELLDNGWDFATGTVSVAGGRFGGNGYSLTGSKAFSVAVNVGTNPYNGSSYWIKWSALGSGSTIWSIDPGGSAEDIATVAQVHGGIILQSDGTLDLYAGGVFQVTTAVLAVVGEWMHIETRHFADNSTGTFEVWINGTKELNFTGDSIHNNELPSALFISSGNGTAIIDDLVTTQGVHTNFGTHRIHDLLVDGDGTNTAWTGTFADVDDPLGVPDGDTTIATADTIGLQQDYTYENIPIDTETTAVHAVRLNARAKKTLAPNKEIANYTISGATETEHTQQVLSTTYVVKTDLLLVDPNTTSAWTVAAVNALKAGSTIKV